MELRYIYDNYTMTQQSVLVKGFARRCKKASLMLFCAIFFSSCSSTQKSSPQGVNSELADAVEKEKTIEDAKYQAQSEVDKESKKQSNTTKNFSSKRSDRQKTALFPVSIRRDNRKLREVAARLLAKDPKHELALNALALSYRNEKKLGAAELLLNKALQSSPKSAGTLNNLGVIQLDQNDFRGAFASFKKAIESDPGHVEASINLGAIYLKYRQYDKALVLLEPIYKDNPSDLPLANNYAVALWGGGDFEQADEILEKISKRSGQNSTMLLNRAILLIENLGKYKEGLKLIYKVRFLGQDEGRARQLNQLEAKAKENLR